MKSSLTILTIVALSVVAGCQGTAREKEFFAVGFQEGQTLRYKFVSSRDIGIKWGYKEGTSKRGKDKVDKRRESIEMVVSYTPTEISPDGAFTTVKATCESVKINRSKGPSKDAAKSLAGQSFTLVVDASGRIEDYSELDKLIKKAGEKAFGRDRRDMRIKEADMVCDFVATQWFLWDSVSSIKKPYEGVSVGQSWKSKLFLPGPIVMRKGRDVTYTLAEIRESKGGRLAVINSSYSPSESVPSDWPSPYVGSFRIKGTFGFFGGFRVLGLQGRGQELFNLDAGRIEQYNQRYNMEVKAYLPMPLPGTDIRITVEQKLSMQLLGNTR